MEKYSEDTKNILEKIVENKCELALFRYIEGYGSVFFRFAHATKHERTEDIEKELTRIQELILKAVLCTKHFGVVILDNNPTEDYWRWYNKWKTFVSLLDDYDYNKLCEYEKNLDFHSMKKMYAS
jgi:hypothetical protein